MLSCQVRRTILQSSLSRPSSFFRGFCAADPRAAMGTQDSKHDLRSSKDWNAVQYLKFGDQRTRAAQDLLARVPLLSPRRIVDLGCGPGNSTKLLVDRFLSSHMVGVDSSPDMIEKAEAAMPKTSFKLDDLTTYVPEESIDLFFSNAVLQWLPQSARLKTVARLIKTQSSGGVFAFQVPDNFDEPSHAAMREIASKAPWAEPLSRSPPSRDTIESPQQIYDELIPHCSSIDIWHSVYQHIMDDHMAIVDWVKGTGLKPFIDPLDAEQRASFLEEYLARIRKSYPASVDGKVLFRFPRLFVIAIRK